MYTDHFNLRKNIKFNRRVISVSPEVDADGLHTGRWEVVTQKIPRIKKSRAGQPGRSSPMSQEANVSGLASPSASPILHSADLPNQLSSSIDSASDREQAESFKDGYMVPSNFPLLSDSSSGDSALVVRQKAETFDFVIIATGHHWKPRLPEFAGIEHFKGTVMHSHAYKVPYPFKDQRILVVGVGNSGIDLATELSHHARQVFLSSRSGTWILPRFTVFGLPTDHLSSRAVHAIPKSILNFALETITRFSTGDLQKYGLKPEHRPLEAHPTVHGEVLGRITTGKVLVRSNISKFTSSSVIFEDQSEEEIDAVFYCTGYKIEHPFLDSQDILGQQDPKSNKIHLYKNIFPLHYKNIAFIGLVQPGGSILPVAEMQSRYVSRVFAGRCDPLPAERVMRAEVLKHMEEREKSYVPKERHTIEVDYISYMDELAELVGCKVDLWNLWRTNWTLAAMITFGPAIPAQYRLQGPGSWKGAEPTIREACKGYDFTKICGYKAVERLRDVPAGKDDRADEKANTESAN